MTVQQLKDKIAAQHVSLHQKKGHMVAFSDSGPVGMGLIEAIAEVLANQEARIASLEARVGK